MGGQMAKTDTKSLIRTSFFILFATMAFNAFNFFYHFVAARMLGPEEYGIVASLFSIIYIISIGSTTIQNAITKFTAKFKSRNEFGKIHSMFSRATRRLWGFAIISALIWLILSPFIADFLKISVLNVLTLIPIIMLSAIVPLNRGILQGLQKFKPLGWNMVLEGGIRFVLALVFMYIGFKSNSVISAVSIGMGVAFLFTFASLRLGSSKKQNFDSKEIYKFSVITLIALTLITVIYSMDVFLVKHFFDATTAGHYAVLSLLGKIVFFGSTAIGLVMFSKVTETHERDKKESERIFKKSLLFTFIISAAIVLVYFAFSDMLIGRIFGDAYLDIAPLLGWFGLIMTLLSLSYMAVLHKLAIGKKKFIYLIAVGVLAEIILIALFHSSLYQVILSLIVLNAALCISLLIKR